MEPLIVARNVTAVVGETRIELAVGDELTPELARRLGPGKLKSLQQISSLVSPEKFAKLFAPVGSVVTDRVERSARGEINTGGEGLPTDGPAWFSATVAELGLPKKLTAELTRRGQTVGELMRYGEAHGTLGFQPADEKKIQEAITRLATATEKQAAEEAAAEAPAETPPEN